MNRRAFPSFRPLCLLPHQSISLRLLSSALSVESIPRRGFMAKKPRTEVEFAKNSCVNGKKIDGATRMTRTARGSGKRAGIKSTKSGRATTKGAAVLARGPPTFDEALAVLVASSRHSGHELLDKVALAWREKHKGAF
jgi:hypothetical protein